jgi:hypothetical protein
MDSPVFQVQNSTFSRYLRFITSRFEERLKDKFPVSDDCDFFNPIFKIETHDHFGLQFTHQPRFRPTFSDIGGINQPVWPLLEFAEFVLNDKEKGEVISRVLGKSTTVVFSSSAEAILDALGLNHWRRFGSPLLRDLSKIVNGMVKTHNDTTSEFTLTVNQLSNVSGPKKGYRPSAASVFRLIEKPGHHERKSYSRLERVLAIYPEVSRFSECRGLNLKHAKIEGLDSLIYELMSWDPHAEPGAQLEFGVTTTVTTIDNNVTDLNFHLLCFNVTAVGNDYPANWTKITKRVEEVVPEHAMYRLKGKDEAILGSGSSIAFLKAFDKLMQESFNLIETEMEEQTRYIDEYGFSTEGSQATLLVRKNMNEVLVSVRTEVYSKLSDYKSKPLNREFVHTWKIKR